MCAPDCRRARCGSSIDGDNHRSANNVAVVDSAGRRARHSRRKLGRSDHGLRHEHVISAGVRGAHRERCRNAPLPESWQRFLTRSETSPRPDEAAIRSGGAGVDGSSAAGVRRSWNPTCTTCGSSTVTSAATRSLGDFCANGSRRGQNVRVVDLATGSGDIPRLIANHAATVGATASIDAVDQQASTIEIAQKLSADYPAIQFHKADVFRIRRRRQLRHRALFARAPSLYGRGRDSFAQALPRTDTALCSRLRFAARALCHCRRLSSHGRAVSAIR